MVPRPVRPLGRAGFCLHSETEASELATETERPAGTDMPPAYQPAEVEPAIYRRWLEADTFGPDGEGSRADWSMPPFVITQPPPNVNGALHVGHALTFTIEDVMIRRERMLGRPTLWVPGLDHASIAAQVVLDKLLAAEGESRESLGRERYLERMRAFTDEVRSTILGQERRLGLSLDWKRLRFTMDDGSAKAVRVAFKRLYDDGLAYRGERLVNWCPGDLTSVSDLEVVATPTTGTLWTVRYHLVRDDGTPILTRPSAWPPRDQRRSLAIRRSRSIPTMTAIATGLAGRCSSHSSTASCQSLPTTPSSATSGPARSRSRRPTTRPTSRSAGATAFRSST